MTPAELARCAARKIRELGLAKGVLQYSRSTDPRVRGYEQDPSCQKGSVCIRGAMFLCANGDAHRWCDDERVAVEEAVAEVIGMRDVVTFNNADSTTQNDVVTALEKAADILDAKVPA